MYDSNIVGDNLTRLELTVYTENPTAWEQYLKKATMDVNIAEDCDIIENPPNEPSFVRLTFPKASSTKGLKGLYISETVVKAEPGIGLN
jgi:hypothetical protein